MKSVFNVLLLPATWARYEQLCKRVLSDHLRSEVAPVVSQLVAQHLDIERAKSAQAAQNAHLFSQQLTLHAAREREEEKLRSELARRQEHRERGQQRAPS